MLFPAFKPLVLSSDVWSADPGSADPVGWSRSADPPSSVRSPDPGSADPVGWSRSADPPSFAWSSDPGFADPVGWSRSADPPSFACCSADSLAFFACFALDLDFEAPSESMTCFDNSNWICLSSELLAPLGAS